MRAGLGGRDQSLWGQWPVECEFGLWLVECEFGEWLVECELGLWLVECEFGEWLVECGFGDCDSVSVDVASGEGLPQSD